MIGNTTTGGVLEAMIIPSLEHAGYSYQKQAIVGNRPNGRRHKVDVVASKSNRTVIISLKWQQVSGTAEQKIPYEVICLMDAVAGSQGAFDKAYLVLGGPGWTLRDFYISGGLKRFLDYEQYVEILSLETFVARANTGTL